MHHAHLHTFAQRLLFSLRVIFVDKCTLRLVFLPIIVFTLRLHTRLLRSTTRVLTLWTTKCQPMSIMASLIWIEGEATWHVPCRHYLLPVFKRGTYWVGHDSIRMKLLKLLPRPHYLVGWWMVLSHKACLKIDQNIIKIRAKLVALASSIILHIGKKSILKGFKPRSKVKHFRHELYSNHWFTRLRKPSGL